MSYNEEIVRSVIGGLSGKFGSDDLRFIENEMYITLRDYEISKKEPENTQLSTDISPDIRAYQMFFVAKKIEGVSEQSLKYYATVLKMFFRLIQKPLSTITTDDLRFYLASKKNVSLVTVNNERRVLASFFGWLCNEEYISKNPVLKIKNIKEPKVIKRPFTATEIEELRDSCKDLREKAILEVLLSTGMRCGEICQTSKADVDFEKNEILVTGKGNKQRICYLNAPAIKRLKDYLDTRSDNVPALFIGLYYNEKNDGYLALTKSGIARIIKNIGQTAGVKNVHPHRFRRTSATMALQRGMPVEQVRIMLGHEKIDTTMRYAIVADEAVKYSHSKYM